MERRERKPGYFARLKRHKQPKRSPSENAVTEQNPIDSAMKSQLISCPATSVFDAKDISTEADLQRESAAAQPTDSDNSCNTTKQAKREKRRPPGTVEYTVGPQDTLNSISLKFNITPNKLVQLNRLFTRSIYPGQKLFVPDMGQSEADLASQGFCDPTYTNGLSDKGSHGGDLNNRPVKPGHRERSPPSEDESPVTVKFIKMSCKYFTDGMGVVGGVMIVTPNNIMFDPHKSDPLVIEHGCEEYGLICPMEEVLSVALYDDISRMKLKDAPPSELPQDLCPLYRPGEWEQLPSDRDLNRFSRYEELDPKRPIILDDIDFALSKSGSAEGEPSCKSPSDEGFTELEPSGKGPNDVPSPSHLVCSAKVKKTEEEEDKKLAQDRCLEASSESLPLCLDTGKLREGLATAESRGTEGLVNCVNDSLSNLVVDQNRKLSQSKSADTPEECGFQKPCPIREPQNGETEEDELSEEERRKRSYKAEVKSWLLKKMQAPIENMLLSSEEKSKSPPMFLCFKVGKPMRKSFITSVTTSPAHSCRGSVRQPEYWFAVPQERVDHLYAFFIQWSPDVYGKEAREQGFIMVEKEEIDMIDNFFSDPLSCSWEIITINEAKRRQSFGSFDGDFSAEALPILSDQSALLEYTHIEKLACRLPARVQGYCWRLAYSTVEHGTSLKTLYRSLADVESPVLLVVKDMDSQVFGAFSTHPFRVSEHCFGTGETFLFSFCPEIKVYHWSGENSYFVKGNIDSLQMGGGGGNLGLWLDADLYHGTTTRCATFNNQPLAAQQDFNVHSLEVWTFE